MMLHGASTAGNNYWMQPLFKQPHLKGQTIVSNDLSNYWDPRVDNDIDGREEFKKVIEGLPTQITINNNDYH